MILRQGEGVDNFAQRHPLSLALLPQLSVSRFDILFGLAVQPQAEVLVHVIGAKAYRLPGEFVVRDGTRVGLKVFNQSAGQLICVVVDHTHQAIR